MSRSNDDASGLRVLGAGSVSAWGAPAAAMLEIFPNLFRNRLYIINIIFPEFTSLCPVTGQPDFGVIRVEYMPDAWCVESKSFKLYMGSYRSHQSFMETIANTILDDLWQRLEPRWCMVKALFAPRGGTGIHVYAEKYKDGDAARLAAVRQAVADWRLMGAAAQTGRARDGNAD